MALISIAALLCVPIEACDAALLPHETFSAISESLGMTTEKLESTLMSVRDKGTASAASYDEVVANDAIRLRNFGEAFPDEDESMRASIAYTSMGRPDNEVPFIADHIAMLLSSEDEAAKADGLFAAFDRLMIHPLYVTDRRLFALTVQAVESQAVSDHPAARSAAEYALKSLGFVVLPEAADFLRRASREDYWSRLCDASGHRVSSPSEWVYLACGSICFLPPDMSIPILEELTSSSGDPGTILGRQVMKCLDEAWRRKHGQCPLLGAYRMRSADPFVVYPYPEWMYGPGGIRMEWPFGRPEDPRDLGPRRLHIDL